MQRIFDVTFSGLKSLLRAVPYSFAALMLIVNMEAPVTGAELRPYSLPSQKMDSSDQYQQRRVIEERVDESFYGKFEQDSRNYDAKKKAKTKVYLNDKLKKSRTDAEETHYKRLLSILNRR